MPVDPREIVRHHAFVADDVEHVAPPRGGPIVVAAYDPAWPASYDVVVARVRDALGPAVLDLAHVGSTAVPGLLAKPVIDVDLTVADPRDEDAYRPALEAAGLVLSLREPRWHEHRAFRETDAAVADPLPLTNLHVWGPGCPEVARHLLLRDRLRAHPADRERYAAAKRAAAGETNAAGGDVMDYNQHKEPVVRAILDDAFRAEGLLPPPP